MRQAPCESVKLSLGLAFRHPELRALRLALAAVFLVLGVRFLRGRRPPDARGS